MSDQSTISPTPAEPGCAPATCSAVELARRLRDFDEYVDACDEAADWIESAAQEIEALREACFVFLEARKHGGYGMNDAEAAVRAAIAQPNAKLRDAASEGKETP